MSWKTIGLHCCRWALSFSSFIPLGVGFYAIAATEGPPDQKAAAAMMLEFVFFPVALLLAASSALLTRSQWSAWSPVDRLVGLFPLLFYVTLVVFCVGWVILH